MKSLSILILLGTLTAIVVGAFFAVSPVLAENKTQIEPETPINTAVKPLAPVTGSPSVEAPVVELSSVAELNSAEAGTVLASTFTVTVDKNWAALEAQQQAASAEVAAVAEAATNLENFVATVSNGKANQVTGLYVDGVLAFSVRRQPAGNPSFVSETADEVTLFGLAGQYGTQAFLAHNYLAGETFFELTSGQIITLVYGDGSTASFRIEGIRRFQALSPDSTQSSFVDLETGDTLSTSTLFHTIYNNDNAVVLQTCINRDGISTWGRLFITAVPVDGLAE